MESVELSGSPMPEQADNDLERRIRETFSGYSFEVRWPYARPLNPECGSVEVELTTKNGDKYLSNFVTLEYIRRISRKNKVTGECADGVYYWMPQMVVIERITPENIRKTIDYMIEHLEIDETFEKLEES